MDIVAFITDFGYDDWYVASMKGIVLGINPRVRLIDITHNIPAGDVNAGAFALLSSFRSFPKRTVFVVVVDPKVGSERKAMVAKIDDYFFVGPDNGVLSLAFRQGKKIDVRALQEKRYMLQNVSNTFHGRDVFAPAAAYLTKERSLSAFGPKYADYFRLKWPEPTVSRDRISGKVVYIDHFGNAITSIDAFSLERLDGESKHASCSTCKSIPIHGYYVEVEEGKPIALIGSSGFLEISLNRGSAASSLGIRVGDAVEVFR
jgi:S-adenosylmethionine hydrolase